MPSVESIARGSPASSGAAPWGVGVPTLFEGQARSAGWASGKRSTLHSFRKEIERENLGLVIVFDREFYGIFSFADLMSVTAKMKFRELNPVRTWEEIYLKYTGKPP